MNKNFAARIPSGWLTLSTAAGSRKRRAPRECSAQFVPPGNAEGPVLEQRLQLSIYSPNPGFARNLLRVRIPRTATTWHKCNACRDTFGKPPLRHNCSDFDGLRNDATGVQMIAGAATKTCERR